MHHVRRVVVDPVELKRQPEHILRPKLHATDHSHAGLKALILRNGRRNDLVSPRLQRRLGAILPATRRAPGFILLRHHLVQQRVVLVETVVEFLKVRLVADVDRPDEIDRHPGLGQFPISRHESDDGGVERLRHARPIRVHRHPDELMRYIRCRLGLLRSPTMNRTHQRQPNHPTCPTHRHFPAPYPPKRQIALPKWGLGR